MEVEQEPTRELKLELSQREINALAEALDNQKAIAKMFGLRKRYDQLHTLWAKVLKANSEQ